MNDLNHSFSSLTASLPTFRMENDNNNNSNNNNTTTTTKRRRRRRNCHRRRRLRLSRPSNWVHVTPEEFLEWKQEKDAMKSHHQIIVGQRHALRTLRLLRRGRHQQKKLELPFRRKFVAVDSNETTTCNWHCRRHLPSPCKPRYCCLGPWCVSGGVAGCTMPW